MVDFGFADETAKLPRFRLLTSRITVKAVFQAIENLWRGGRL
jgi:hypothetical protein